MPSSKRNTCRRRFVRKLCAVFALLAYLAVAVGLPLPAVARKDVSQPFPCQDHACGCRSAEECWLHCCCFTPEQRWPWAEAHGVVPPAYAERPTRPAGETESCPHASGPAARSCCGRHHQASPPPPPAGARWVMGVESLRCRGLTTLWASAGAVVPPPPVLSWRPFWPLRGALSFADASPRVHLPVPPDPPPRRSGA